MKALTDHLVRFRSGRRFALTALLMAQLAAILFPVHAALADNPLNGAAPRPFYIFKRNPNTVADVDTALQDGANALEPDITWYNCGGAPLDNLVDCDSDDPFEGCGCGSTKFVDWLEGVHNLAANQHKGKLALIVFDCKDNAALNNGPDNGVLILQAIRDHLNTGDVSVNVLLSVGKIAHGALFDHLSGAQPALSPGLREGLQIDAEDDVDAVLSFFRSTEHYFGNVGYSDGTTAGDGIGYHAYMDNAVGERAAFAEPQAVPYAFTLQKEKSMRDYINDEVDGIITDDVPLLKSVVNSRTDVVAATPIDNPFRPLNEAYALQVRTGNDGTDANLTFTLLGANGSSTITVDTSHVGRMESGDTNWVTMPSRDLGQLQSVSVHNDGTGNGPPWNLLDITVYSARYIAPSSCAGYTAIFNTTVPANGTKSAMFQTDQYVWLAAPPPLDGSSAHPWHLFSDGYCAVSPYGVIHAAAGQYAGKITLNKPCRVEFWPAHGAGPARIGSN